MTKQEVHISSLVVHVRPEYLNITKKQISEIENVEIYGDSPEGKIVVVLETINQGFITEKIDKINNLEYVLTTFLVYHQIDEEEICEQRENNL